MTNGEEGSQGAVESALVGWEAMLGCGEKLLVLMVLIRFCFETREMGVLKKCQNPIVGGVVSLGLKQHCVYVRGRLDVSLLIVNARVVHRVAGEAIHNVMLNARPPHCSDLVKGQFLLQTDQTKKGQLVNDLGVEDGYQRSVVHHKLEVCAGQEQVGFVDLPHDP